MTLLQLQFEVAEWGRRNFPNALPYQPLLGAQEEIGELAHAHLKMEQGIRGTRLEHIDAKCDAVADCVIFLAHYCELNGLEFSVLVEEVWNQVKQRDWIKFPKNGKTE
jgi:NTP pyrophosphatase (non-canonical NTP hydrolase)